MTEPKPHRLTRTQFDALAAGGGDDGTLAVLSRGQLSKRLLLLREVRFGTALGASDAWRVLDEAMARRPEAVRAVVSRPFVDAWATRALRGADGGPGGRYLAGLCAAAGVAAGLPFELQLPGEAESALLPGLGEIRGLGAGWRTLRHEAGALCVDGGGRPPRIQLASGPDGTGGADGEHWAAIRTVPWAAAGVDVELDDLDPYRSCFGLPPVSRLDGGSAGQAAALLSAALAMVEDEYPRYRPTVRACLRSLVPVAAPAAGSVSASNQNAFGAIAVSPPADGAALALLLVHEAQHAKLGALLDLVDLVDPAATGVYHAPWRSDPRPAGALLQGVYAHAAVADFWRERRHRLGGERGRAAEFEYVFWRNQARRAAGTLLGSPALTVLGRSFVETLARTLDGWSDECHPRVRGAVSECATVTGVAWRLRNHQVSMSWVSRLAVAYESGEACPAVPPAEVQVGGPGGSAMAGDLVRAIRQRAVDPVAAEPHGGSAVVAEPTGERAVANLDGRLRRHPDDADTWALLALTLSRRGQAPAALAVAQRPELIRALVAELAGRADASAVAGWLAFALTS